ncbi:unnamed protein product [Scytosiphon promiscuus]
MRGALLRVLQMEGLGISSETLDAVIDVCRGDASERYICCRACVSVRFLDATMDLSSQLVDRVPEECGLPTPSENGHFLHFLLNGTVAVAFRSLSSRLSEKGFALAQVISVLAEKVVAPEKIEPERMKKILLEFANIEWSLSDGGKDSLGIRANSSPI